MKRKYKLIFLLLLLIIIVAVIMIFFPQIFKRYHDTKTVNVFGAPRSQTQQNFPKDKPKFSAVIGTIKPASVHQQLLKVYEIGDEKKSPVFERPFYADGFHGNELTYTFSSNSAEITQTGTLGMLGCKADACMLHWRNFYTWDASHHTFVLDNLSHKEEFQQLLTTYQEIDKNGCAIVGKDIIPGEQEFSFTELYKKDPTAQYYCSKTQGILPSNLVFFLQAEKTLNAIVNGENLSSADIRNIPF